MNKRGLGTWALALVVTIGGLAAGWALLVGKPRPEPAPVPQPVPPLVRFVTADPQPLALSVSTQGTVQAERQINLTAQVSGRVVAVHENFAAGSFFRAGERLLQIETADYEVAIARAESQLAAAQQRLAEEEGLARQAKREWRELGTSKANALFLREPQLVSARAALKAAEADLRAAKLNLARTSLSLPFDGRLVSKAVDVGQFVAAGTAVAAAYGTERMQIRLPVTDRQLALLDLPLSWDDRERPGPAVVLRAVVAGEPRQWQGRIARTDASIDVDSRVLYAVAVVDQPFAQGASQDVPLTPGLFVEAEIEGVPLSGLTRLPRSALQNDGTVLLVGAESRLASRIVATRYSDGRHAWVQGLEPGDRVVATGGGVLYAGMTVTAAPAQQIADGGAR